MMSPTEPKSRRATRSALSPTTEKAEPHPTPAKRKATKSAGPAPKKAKTTTTDSGIANVPEDLKVGSLVSEEYGISLLELIRKGENGAILFFYPKANTPGCTKQANNFNASLSDFNDKGYIIYGLSHDKFPPLRKFTDNQGLEFELLSDVEGKVSSHFGVKKGTSVNRSVFVVNTDGKVMGGGKASPADSVGMAEEIIGNAEKNGTESKAEDKMDETKDEPLANGTEATSPTSPKGEAQNGDAKEAQNGVAKSESSETLGENGAEANGNEGKDLAGQDNEQAQVEA